MGRLVGRVNRLYRSSYQFVPVTAYRAVAELLGGRLAELEKRPGLDQGVAAVQRRLDRASGSQETQIKEHIDEEAELILVLQFLESKVAKGSLGNWETSENAETVSVLTRHALAHLEWRKEAAADGTNEITGADRPKG